MTNPTDNVPSGNFSWGAKPTQFFFNLTPDRVLDAVEAAGFTCTGRCMALNSMENRVYEVEIELDPGHKVKSPAEKFRIVKFYRPGRWTEAQILEEHEYLLELQAQEIPVVFPLKFQDGSTLKKVTHPDFADAEIWYALFSKVGGRSPDEFTDPQLERIGRLLGRIHAVGAGHPAKHRIHLNADTYGRANLEFLLSENIIPEPARAQFERYGAEIIRAYEERSKGIALIRVHGDCHLGNLLWNDQGPFFLDFDDFVTGPAVQDLWLLIRGRDEEAKRQFGVLVDAYAQMRHFNVAELNLVEPLRGLRFIHLCAWIAKRWEDPAFPNRFPQFGEPKYWQDQADNLREVVELLN